MNYSLTSLLTSKNSMNQRIQKRQNTLLELGSLGWGGAYSSVDAVLPAIHFISFLRTFTFLRTTLLSAPHQFLISA